MAPASGEKVVRVRVEGRVQGVWFRAWTTEQATRRGLRGWVRNRRDGSVEALFAGAPAAVDDMVAACWQGPQLASVEKVTPIPAEAVSEEGFRQLPTA